MFVNLLVILAYLQLHPQLVQAFELCQIAKNETLCKLNEQYHIDYPPLPGPVVIQPFVSIIEITGANEERQSISILAEIIQEWNDPTLSMKGTKQTWYRINTFLDSVWHPVLYFLKVLSIEKIQQLGKKTNYDLWIKPSENRLWYRETLEVTFACKEIDFSKFPFDQHQCDFNFGDGGEYGIEKMIYNFSYFSYDFNYIKQPNISLIILDSTTEFTYELQATQPFLKESILNISYQFTGIRLILKRKNLGSLMSTFYFPTALFTFISMLSFLIKPDAVPGRMGMIIMLLLITSNVYIAIEAPKKRGFSNAEVWIVGSQIPIIFALLEYGVILMMTRKNKSNELFLLMDVSSFFISAIYYFSFNIYYWNLVP